MAMRNDANELSFLSQKRAICHKTTPVRKSLRPIKAARRLLLAPTRHAIPNTALPFTLMDRILESLLRYAQLTCAWVLSSFRATTPQSRLLETGDADSVAKGL